MQTQAGDPGAFAHFDLNRVASPAFVVDEAAIRRNLSVLKTVRDGAEARVLLALKAFSMWSLADVVGEYLDGVCASGLWEARLAREFYKGELTTYSPAYTAQDLPEILRLSDHVIFNNPAQIARFADLIAGARAEGQVFEIGLRLNPEHLTVGLQQGHAHFAHRLGDVLFGQGAAPGDPVEDACQPLVQSLEHSLPHGDG